MSEPPVTLITGAASGIGLCLAEILHTAEHRLVVTDVDIDAMRARAGERGWQPPQVEVIALDVRDAAGWQEAIQFAIGRFGRLDVLLNVAGIVRPGWVHERTPDDIALHMDVNAKGVMLGTQAAAVEMVRQGSGHIVNMGSMAALAPIPGIAMYTASKFAVRGFSLAVAQELRPHGVHVTVVCPDAVATPMLDLQLDYDEAALTFSTRRALTADEVARAIVDVGLRRRPLELVLPRSRGWLAKLGGALPPVATLLLPRLRRRGLARQAAAREARLRDAPSG